MSTSEPTEGKSRATEVLEVEDEESRQARMHAILQRLDATDVSPSIPEGPPKFDFGDRTIFPVPPSDLLSRVQAFLPELAASNAEVARAAELDPSNVDIEELGDSEQYIEMNLGLGVFESRRAQQGNVDDDDEEMGGSSSVEDSSQSSEGEESGSELNSDDASTTSSESDDSTGPNIDAKLNTGTRSDRPIKPLPKRRRPEIVVLGGDTVPEGQGST